MAMQGVDPFSKDEPKPRPVKVRYVPPPDKLQPLTPEIFDAMFQGKSAKKGKGRQAK